MFPVWFTGHFSIEWSWNKTGNTLNQKTCYGWYTGSTQFWRDYHLGREQLLPKGWHLRKAKLSDQKQRSKKKKNAWSQVKRSQPWLFKVLIALSPRLKYIQWITQLDSLIIIHWIIIYPADSTIQRLNNWGQPFNRQQQQDQSFSRVLTRPDTGLRNWTHLDPVHNWAVPWLHTYASAILSFKMPEHACKKPLPTKNPGVEQPFLFGDTQANTDNPWPSLLWEIEGLFFI